MSWTIDFSRTYQKKQKQFTERRPRELRAALGHAQDLLAELNQGANPINISHGWLHNERQGLYATDQRGAGKGATPLRLYIYPDTATRILWFLTIGDKNSQKRDIQDCRDMVAGLAKLRDVPDGREAGADPPDEDGAVS